MESSPITHGQVKNLDSLNASEIITAYRNRFGIDVSANFAGIEKFQLLECIDTGYMFFSPKSITGDSKLYELLQRFPWYYLPWKWEHSEAIKYIRSGDCVLEVGCGYGGFLERLTKYRSGIKAIGLELNSDVVNSNNHKGLTILPEFIEEHAVNALNSYDVVCSFQVLEHIYDVRQFIESQIKVLNTGGKLIVAVPNNDSFIKRDKSDYLNIPPHHMGRWSRKSLNSLVNYFPLKVVKVSYEPLQKYHVNWFINIKIYQPYPYIKRFVNTLKLNGLLRRLIQMFAFIIRGHTILVVYEKK